jgi:hypothetical protein
MPDDVTPGPLGIPTSPALTGNGILTRTAPITPGPVGLKGGNAKGGAAPLGDQVVSFAKGRISKKVGSGECYDLADRALRNAGAKSAPDYGETTPTADYVWGREVSLADVRPGDIIQFRNYRFDRRVDRSDGSYTTKFQERPHHTAIVETTGENGMMTVLEQNAPPGSPVQRTQLYFANSSINEGGTKTTVTVQGQIRFYRPEAS